jgi:hypothetical protein
LPSVAGAAALCRRHYRRTLSAWLLVLYWLDHVNMVLGAPAACAAVPGWLVTRCYFWPFESSVTFSQAFKMSAIGAMRCGLASCARCCRSGNVTLTVRQARGDLHSLGEIRPVYVTQPTLCRVPHMQG